MSRRTPRLATAVLAAFATLLLGACSEDTTVESTETSGANAKVGFPVTVDSLTLEKRPERIVSLSPTATEMLFAIGAGEQVAAVDDLSNYPAEAPRSDLSAFNPNAEAIAAKNPDLVVLSNDMNKIVSQLATLKIPVYHAPAAQSLDDTYEQLADLGSLTGHVDEAADVTRQMRTDINKLVEGLPKRSEPLTYFHELGPDLYTVTSKTFVGSIYSLAGLQNIADPADADGAKGGYPQLNQETIVKADPDFIFLADVGMAKQSPETVKARAGWDGLTAVKKNQIVPLDDDIASRWGPRVVDLLRQIVDATAKVPA